MKILLLGEYSGVHANLSSALRTENFEVLSVHSGDGYKNINADIYISYKRYNSKNKIISMFFQIYYKLLSLFGLKGIFQIHKYNKILKELKGYDVVQLINPFFLTDFGFIVNFMVFKKLKAQNNKFFLCALGDDYYWVKSCLTKKYKYSMFDRLKFKTFKNYSSQLLWVVNPFYIFLNKYIVKNVNAVIPGLYEYYFAYKNTDKCTEIVPIIMEVKNKKMNISYPIKIFHGWQFGKEYQKGNDVIHEVIMQLKNKYSEKIEYQVVGGVPFSEYINKFNDCHIFVDQCYSYDTGVNGLLGMSHSKVVLSGFESEVQDYYSLEYSPLVNITPDKLQLFKSIEFLILNPLKIQEYSLNASKFIEKYHSSEYIIPKYKKIWSEY